MVDLPRVIRPGQRAAPPAVRSPNGVPRPVWTAWHEIARKGDRWRVAAFGQTFAETLAAAQAKGHPLDAIILRTYGSGPPLPTTGSRAAL